MSNVSVNYTMRLDADVKRECEEIYGELGMNLSTAINVFLRKSMKAGGFPFDVRLEDKPNRETVEALMEAERIGRDASARRYHSVKELFADLESDEK